MTTPEERSYWRKAKVKSKARKDLDRWHHERCARCGFSRINVIHETDREHAPEGLAYYADVPFCAFEATR